MTSDPQLTEEELETWRLYFLAVCAPPLTPKGESQVNEIIALARKGLKADELQWKLDNYRASRAHTPPNTAETEGECPHSCVSFHDFGKPTERLMCDVCKREVEPIGNEMGYRLKATPNPSRMKGEEDGTDRLGRASDISPSHSPNHRLDGGLTPTLWGGLAERLRRSADCGTAIDANNDGVPWEVIAREAAAALEALVKERDFLDEEKDRWINMHSDAETDFAKMVEERDDLQDTIAALRAALEWYADLDNWHFRKPKGDKVTGSRCGALDIRAPDGLTVAIIDRGARARAALATGGEGK